MRRKIAIDGNKLNGHYRVDCECGDNWSGIGKRYGLAMWSPAGPIAEAVAHQHMTHDGDGIDVQWTVRFSQWLLQYWEFTSTLESEDTTRIFSTR